MVGITESFVLSGTKGASARVMVLEDYDPLANTSDITVAVEVASSSYYGFIYYLTGSVAAAGQTLQSMRSETGVHKVYIQKLNTYYAIVGDERPGTGSPWSLSDIAHNVDGSKTITVSVNLTGQEVNNQGADGWTLTGSKEITLTHIPRASTVAATDAAIGAVSMVAVSRKSAEYSHSIAYRFGNLCGYLCPEGLSESEVRFSESSVAFPLPESFYSQIPNAKSGSCTLSCVTYRGDTQVGDTQTCQFAVMTNEALCAPLLGGTVTDTNAVTLAQTADANILVRYMSDALCVMQVQPQKEAAITEKSIGGISVTEDRCTISGIETGSVVFSATDSRGYSTSVTVEKTLIPYIRLTCHPVGKRTDPTSGNAKLSVSGDYFAGSFGQKTNALTLQYRINGGAWVQMVPEIADGKYAASADLTGLTYTYAHSIEVQASDKLQTVTTTVPIGKGIPVFDWGEQDFCFHVPVYLQNSGIFHADGREVFAPYGYGLGTNAAETADLNEALGCGWYGFYYGCANAPFDCGTVLTLNRSKTEATQLAFGTGLASGSAARRIYTGQWQPWEYIDPPMEPGVEYRTTLRWDGKPVYRKLVTYTNLSDLSGETLCSIPHGISNMDVYYGTEIRARTQGYQIPNITAEAATAVTGCSATDIELQTSGSAYWSAGRVWYFDVQYVKAE